MAASDSVRWQVALAAQQVLTGLTYAGLFDVTGPANQAQGVQLIPNRLTAEAEPDKNLDVAPMLILVSEIENNPELQFNDPTDGASMHSPYPVLVIFLQNRGHQPEQGQLEANIRELVRMRLFTPGAITNLLGFALQPQNFNISYDPKPGVAPNAWGPDFKATAQRFTFVVADRRANVGGY